MYRVNVFAVPLTQEQVVVSLVMMKYILTYVYMYNDMTPTTTRYWTRYWATVVYMRVWVGGGGEVGGWCPCFAVGV